MKIKPEILNKIKDLEIYTKKVLRGSMICDKSSLQKGIGIEFDQIRDYAVGDDVRFIDWKSSARHQKMMVKEYIEERNRDILLLIDVSGSLSYGSSSLKSELISQVASVLAMVSSHSKDNVGAVFFNDSVVKYIPTMRSVEHVHNIINTLFKIEFSGKTSIKNALEYVARKNLKKSVIFIISDFIDEGYEKILKIMSNIHEIIIIKCNDSNETKALNVGYLQMIDPETGQFDFINTNSLAIDICLKNFYTNNEKFFRSCKIDNLNLTTDSDFIFHLVKFFKKKMIN